AVNDPRPLSRDPDLSPSETLLFYLNGYQCDLLCEQVLRSCVRSLVTLGADPLSVSPVPRRRLGPYEA
ncbi:uncharacterized, partial [Tachysurus ichikawai]